MLGIERKRLIEIIDPFGKNGTWNPHDQIEIDRFDAGGSNMLDCSPDIARFMMPLEHLERCRLKTLATDAHTIDTAFDENIGDSLVHSLGVCFDGPFTVRRERQVPRDGAKQTGQKFWS